METPRARDIARLGAGGGGGHQGEEGPEDVGEILYAPEREDLMRGPRVLDALFCHQVHLVEHHHLPGGKASQH